MENLIDEITKQVLVALKKSDAYVFGVPIGISNRHVHLSQENLEALFGQGYTLTKLKDLSQTGQFAAKETVTISNGDRKIENVRILGPCRKQTQVEISQTDARYLKVTTMVRNSGDLSQTAGITIETPYKSIEIGEGCIVAARHLHLSEEDALRFGVEHNERVSMRIKSDKAGVIEGVVCKVHATYVLEVHLDTDDGNAFLLETGDIAELIK